MQMLTIEAVSTASAQGLLEALSEFRPRLVVSEDNRQNVVVDLGANAREIVDVLNRLERYVVERADGPARLELAGRSYTLHPESAAP